MFGVKPGDVVLIGAGCSVQFTGYVLGSKGLATAKRELYVMRAGLVVQRSTAPAMGQPRRSSGRAPASGISRQPSRASRVPTAGRLPSSSSSA